MLPLPARRSREGVAVSGKRVGGGLGRHAVLPLPGDRLGQHVVLSLP